MYGISEPSTIVSKEIPDQVSASPSNINTDEIYIFSEDKAVFEVDSISTYDIPRNSGNSQMLHLEIGSVLPPSPYLPPTREYSRVVQKWEGHVIEIHEDTFTARLIPISGEGSEQEAEIFIEEVSAEDLSLLKPGAVFYWSIGYHSRPCGSRMNVSVIRFRRLPIWTRREIEDAKSRSKRFFETE